MSLARLAIWDLSGRIVNYLVIFVVGVVLTRLLSPTEFGAFGIVMSVVSLSAFLIDYAFRPAIIQSQEITQEQLSTIFYLTLLVALVLILLLCVSAGFVENFYQIEGLAGYIIFASLTFALNALLLVPGSLLQKNLELKTISVINTAAALTSGAAGIFFAYNGYKVWALVIQQLISGFLVLLATAYFARWLPSASFNLSAIKKLWQYGSNLLWSGMLNAIFSKFDVFIIGKLFPLATLGFYLRAQSLDLLIRNFSVGTTGSIAFPVLAKMSDDMEQTQKFYLRCLHVIAFLSFFLIGILFLTCFDIVIILFTEKWLPVGSYFRVIAVTGFVYPVSALMVSVLSARGNSKEFLRLEIVKTVIFLTAYLSFFAGGVYLFLISLGMALMAGLIANGYYVQKEIAISLKDQLQVIFKYGAIAAAAVAVVYGLTFYIENIYLHLILSSFLFAIIYSAFNRQFRLPGFTEVYDRILNFYNDKRYANISPAS